MAGDVALEAAADSGLGLALFFASFDVVTGGFVVSHAGVRDGFQGGVELSVAGAVEAMVLGVARGDLQGTDAADLGEAGFVMDAAGV